MLITLPSWVRTSSVARQKKLGFSTNTSSLFTWPSRQSKSTQTLQLSISLFGSYRILRKNPRFDTDQKLFQLLRIRGSIATDRSPQQCKMLELDQPETRGFLTTFSQRPSVEAATPDSSNLYRFCTVQKRLTALVFCHGTVSMPPRQAYHRRHSPLPYCPTAQSQSPRSIGDKGQ